MIDNFKKRTFLVHLFSFVVLTSILVFLLYFKLWRSYFAQDEWFYFGLFNPQLSNPFGLIELFAQQFTMPKAFGIHFTPLWNSVFFLEYQIFGVTYQYYALLAMALHIITATLVFLLAYRLTKSKFISYMSGFSYAAASSLYEGLTWANAHLQSQLPSILVLLLLLLWVEGLEKSKTRFLVIATMFLIVALLIKESVFGVFLVMFCMIFLYGVRKIHRKSISILATGFIGYSLFRVIAPLVALQFDSSYQMASPFPKLDAGPIIFRFALYPFKAILQHFLSEEIIINISEAITRWNYPNLYGKDAALRSAEYTNFIYSAGSDMAMIILAVPTGLLLWYFYKKTKVSKDSARLYLFCLIFIVGSVFPLIFIAPWLLTLFPYVTFIESRYFYLIGIGLCMLFAVLVKTLLTSIVRSNHNQYIRKIFLSFFWIFLILFFVREIYATRTIVSKNIAIGEERHIITDYIKAVYPTLQDKSVFFITSNKPYFGFAHPMVPFQTNFGSTLLTVYYREMHYDHSFYDFSFLAEKGVTGEGYRESQGKGFGYFIKGESLQTALKNHNLTPSNVYSFHYDGHRKVISSTTDEVRVKLRQEQEYTKAVDGWQRYEDSEGKYSFLYPPHYSIKNTSDSFQKITSILDNSGETLYEIVLPEDKKIKVLDDTSADFKNIKEDWVTADSHKNSRYFSHLVKNDVITLQKDGQEQHFFYHPKSYIILRIAVNNTEQVENSQLPLDLLLWTFKFY